MLRGREICLLGAGPQFTGTLQGLERFIITAVFAIPIILTNFFASIIFITFVSFTIVLAEKLCVSPIPDFGAHHLI